MTGAPDRQQREAERARRRAEREARAERLAVLYREWLDTIAARDAARRVGEHRRAELLAARCLEIRAEVHLLDPPQAGHLSEAGKAGLARGQRVRRERERAEQRRARYRTGGLRAGREG